HLQDGFSESQLPGPERKWPSDASEPSSWVGTPAQTLPSKFVVQAFELLRPIHTDALTRCRTQLERDIAEKAFDAGVEEILEGRLKGKVSWSRLQTLYSWRVVDFWRQHQRDLKHSRSAFPILGIAARERITSTERRDVIELCGAAAREWLGRHKIPMLLA